MRERTKRPRNESGRQLISLPRAARRQSKRPRTGRGLSVSETKEDSVPAATEVEAVDQLAADRLHVLFRIFEADTGRQDRHQGSAGPGERRIFGAIARVAILGLPEQSRDEVEAVFVAGREEPALILLRVHRDPGRRVVQEVREGDALEAGFG